MKYAYEGDPPMDDDVRLWTRPGLDLQEPLVVAGVPTLGLVGTIVSHYVHETLEMEPVGGLRSPYFPPVGRVDEGRPRRPFGIYALETSCGPDGQCDHLVVVESDFLPIPPVQDAAARTVMGWLDELDARWVVVPDGLHVQDPEASEAVHGVASSEAGLSRVESMGARPIGQGVLGGLSSLLLFEGEERGVETLCLLAESSPDHPDARAAAELVKLLDPVVPEVSIEAAPLLEEAERIEAAVRENRQMLEQQADDLPGPESMMFG